jgi:hypothetical protein
MVEGNRAWEPQGILAPEQSRTCHSSMTADSTSSDLPFLDTLHSVIAQGREEDPLLGPKLGSEVALEMLLDQLGTERGVHAETLMACTGVLMGQSSQASLLTDARQEGRSRVPGLQVVQCQDGSTCLVGDPLNRQLMDGYASPWAVLSEAAQQEGCDSLPEMEQLLLDGIARLGTPAFGTPQVPAEHAPQRLEPAAQENLWLLIRPLCLSCCSEPREWPLLCGLLAVRALRLVKPHLEPALAFRLAMDSAIDAAKVPLAENALPD